MTYRQMIFITVPAILMILTAVGMQGIEYWLASFGKSPQSYQILGRLGLALPFATAAIVGMVFLFAANGAVSIKFAGLGVLGGGVLATCFGLLAEVIRLYRMAAKIPQGTLLPHLDLYTLGGAACTLFAAIFGLRVALRGNAAFANTEPKRLTGKRAIHGDSRWMDSTTAGRLFPKTGGIVIGELYRVDRDSVAQTPFDPRRKETWGQGGKGPLLGFDCSFGSTHGIAFAGSGGFKTTSVGLPTTLNFSGSRVVLDPSTEIAPMVRKHLAETKGQDVYVLDPQNPEGGFNALDWIGRFGNSPEEDIASVAAWLMSEKPRLSSGADDFFRTSAEQLITGVIADVMLSDPEDTKRERTLRAVRQRLAEPEKTLQKKLSELYTSTTSDFVREVIGLFTNMTEQTFSGVYATAAKETHWLSYDNYAALVSGSHFKTDVIANGRSTVFINLDLSALENHPGIARVIIGAFLKAVYNRKGDIDGRVLFLLDEAARLGYMRIIETARDAGRKYGISLLMLFQSIGQMREAFGGRDATSKWFESASWVSFAAINDPETARYISERCGMTTVELGQVSRTSRHTGSSRTRSTQLTQRPLILPHEIQQMRLDEQIVLTAGNPPLRCGRAIYFRRPEMTAVTAKNTFQPTEAVSQANATE